MNYKLDPKRLCFFMCCYFSFISTEVQLINFHELDVSNYSTLLLSEDKDVLYVGAREVIFALNAVNIAEKQHEVMHFNTYLSCKNHSPNFTSFPAISTSGGRYLKEKILVWAAPFLEDTRE